VRGEAESLVKRAAGADPSGPVLRSQIQRLQILLPTFDVTVRLELVSDNATQGADPAGRDLWDVLQAGKSS